MNMKWTSKNASQPRASGRDRNRAVERYDRQIREMVGPIRRARSAILASLLNDDDGRDVTAPSPVEQPDNAEALMGEAANYLQAAQARAMALRLELAELRAGHVRLALALAESLETLAHRLDAMITPPRRRG